MERKYRTAKTVKDYSVNYKGWDIVVPAGSNVSNSTAGGYDNDYHFWFGWKKQIEELTGHTHSCLRHDLTYYGLDIPAEYCEPYADIE